MRESIPTIIKEWLNDRSKLIKNNKKLDLILSFERSENEVAKVSLTHSLIELFLKLFLLILKKNK